MRTDVWPERGPVRTPSGTVYHNFLKRPIVSASVDASVQEDRVSARTGTIMWESAQQESVGPSVPRRGDRVSIDAGDDGHEARVFIGRVDTTNVQVPGDVVSEVVDDFGRLSREVNVPCLLARMPPYIEGGITRPIGLTATWPIQYALTQVGFFSTPPARTNPAVSASLNGSVWPERGDVESVSDIPAFYPSPWGEVPDGFAASYAGANVSMSSGPLELSLLVDTKQGGASSYVDAVATDGNRVRLLVQANGNIAAQYGATPSTVLSMSVNVRTTDFVALRVTRSGAWSLTDGATTVTANRVVSTAMQARLSSVYVNVPAGARRIGGLNVAYPPSAPAPWRCTAILDAPDGTLTASRAILSKTVESILTERASAEKARMWIDADAVFHWSSRNRWGTGPITSTITDVDLLSYRVSVDYDSTYSHITVKSLKANTQIRVRPTLTLYEGNSQTLLALDDQVEFIEPSAEEDWVQVDRNMRILGVESDSSDFNRGRGTWGGATRVTEPSPLPEEDWWAQGPEGNYASFDFRQISLRKWLSRIYIDQALPAGDAVEMRTVRRDKYVPGTELKSQWDNKALPIVRGQGQVLWEGTSTASTAATVDLLPPLTHDAGWWVQGAAVNNLVAWLSQTYAAPAVTIQNVDVVPDARIEIGDVIRITDSTYGDLSAKCAVAGVHHSIRNGQASMSIDVDVLTLASTRRTYDTVKAEASASTYAAFQAIIGSVTYEQQEAI